MDKAVDKLLGIDWGSKRVGVAVGNSVARLASPLTILENNTKLFDNLKRLIKEHEATALVVGLPRGMDGQETAQSEEVRRFAGKLREKLGCAVKLQDETLTSVNVLDNTNKPRGAIDSQAAALILQDYLNSL